MSPLRLRDFVLAPASALYWTIIGVRGGLYRAGFLRDRRLRGHVVSVGNLTVGGTGKTPAIITLAGLLGRRGHRLGVLTRGYGRRNEEELVILNSTETPSGEVGELVDRAGDEPVLLARRLPEIPIGIAADRFEAGRALEERHGVDLFLLDDGFQHLQLHRDVDIVLLDVTTGDEALLPRGRRREPWSAIRRAHIVLLTRTEQADPTSWIDRVHAMNPAAVIFRAETELDSLRDAATHAEVSRESLKGKRAFAFSGIGNARAFWWNIASWGFDLRGARTFPDHYRYSSEDVRGLLRAAEQTGSELLLTTEKDVVNWRVIDPLPMPAYYCRIAFKIERPDEIIAEIERRLEVSAS